MKNNNLIKLTLLFAASLTVMSGATVAPSLPKMSQVFSDTPGVELLTKLVLTMPALLIAVTGLFAGSLVERFGRLKILYISLILYGIAGSTGYWLNGLVPILIGRALLGISVGGIMTVISTLVGDYFLGDERKKFSATQGMFMSLGGVIFVSVGGALADIDWRLPFTIYLFSFIVIILGLFSLVEPHKQTSETNDNGNNRIPKGMIGVILTTMVLSMIIFYMIPVQIPFLLVDLGIESSALSGYAISVSTVGGAIGALAYARIKNELDYSQIFALSFLSLAIGYIIIGLSTKYEVIMTALCISGFGVGFVLPNGTLWLLDVTPLKARGIIMGLFTSAIFLGQFLSPLVVQPLSETAGLQLTFRFVGIGSVILAIVYVLIIRSRVNASVIK